MRKRRDAEACVRAMKRIAESNDERKGLCYITDVPVTVFIDILLRLPLKDILVCKCVCKEWKALILSTHFAGVHSAQSEKSLLVQSLESLHSPRICRLFDPADVHMNLNVRMKMPLRNAKGALSKEAVKKNHCIRLRRADHGYTFVNSCNGLICLSSLSTNDPAVVSNPVTGEYINIPKGHISLDDFHVDCGFGFCPATSQYKVIRLDYYLSSGRRAAEVHTLGTQTWRALGFAPDFYNGDLRSPTYLNGRLHWFYPEWISWSFIISFDFGDERFRPFPPPGFYKSEFLDKDVPNASMGVLRGKLCVCRSRSTTVTLWVMEEYGVAKSWARFAEIQKECGDGLIFQPIEYLRNGTLVVSYDLHIVFLHYNVDSREWHTRKVYGMQSNNEVVPFVPSFLSLKQAVPGNERRVMSIASRCGKIKSQGERQRFIVYDSMWLPFKY